MLHPSLLVLSKLRLKGQLRQMKRTLSSPKGIVLSLMTLGFVGMAVFPLLFARQAPAEMRPMITWFVHPAALFMLWTFTVAGSSVKNPIAFSMSEIDFLFPGPYTRRQLLIYKLSATLIGTLGFALMMSIFLPWAWWPAVFLGFWLTGIFMHWSSVLTALLVNWLGTRFWWLLAAAGLALLGFVALSSWQAGVFAPGVGIRERLAALETSWATRGVLAPFVVYSRLIMGQSLAAVAGWGTAALAIVAVVGAAILRLDRNFLEASLQASRRRYATLERMKRSGGMVAAGGREKPRFSLRDFPRLGGAGPIAWRQALHILRSSGVLLFALPAVVGPFAAIAILANRRGDDPVIGIVIAMTLLVGFLINTIVPLGLRTDLDQVDVLKSLPLRADPIVWGSILAAIAYITLVQLVAVTGVSIAIGRWTAGAALALAIALPVNLLLVAADGILVLLFPGIRHINPQDPLSGARIVLVNMVKVFFSFACAGVALVGVLVARLVFGDSWLAMAAAGCGLLALEGVATVWVAARLFARYDASAHAGEAG